MSKTLVIEVPQLYIPVGEEPGAQEMKEMYKDLGSNAPLSAYRAHKHGEWISKHTEAALGSIALPFMLEKHLVVVMHGTYGPALALKILGEEDPVSEELRERIFDEAEGVTIEFEWTGDFEATFIRNSEES